MQYVIQTNALSCVFFTRLQSVAAVISDSKLRGELCGEPIVIRATCLMRQ